MIIFEEVMKILRQDTIFTMFIELIIDVKIQTFPLTNPLCAELPKNLKSQNPQLDEW